MIKSFRDEYFFLSNMYECTIEWQGLVYPSVENAYQASKCAVESEKIHFTQVNPHESKKMGKSVIMIQNFDDIKYELMRDLLDIKFKNPDLLARLLSTAPESIIEGNWWHDNYWGVCQCSRCKDKIHQNKLGELLQRKRNLSAQYSDLFTMYCGSIYNRQNQAIVERPSILYDKDTYAVIKVGPYDMCMHYLSIVANTSSSLSDSLVLYEFDTTPLMGMYLACEKMNQALQITGGLKNILQLD